MTHDPAPRLPSDESPAAPIEILDPFGRAVLMDAYGRFMRPPFDPNAAQPAAAAHEQASSTIGGPSESVTAAGWEFVGPEGGNVVDLAVSPTEPGLVIAALRYDGVPGLYRSTDGGR